MVGLSTWDLLQRKVTKADMHACIACIQAGEEPFAGPSPPPVPGPRPWPSALGKGYMPYSSASAAHTQNMNNLVTKESAGITQGLQKAKLRVPKPSSAPPCSRSDSDGTCTGPLLPNYLLLQ